MRTAVLAISTSRCEFTLLVPDVADARDADWLSRASGGRPASQSAFRLNVMCVTPLGDEVASIS